MVARSTRSHRATILPELGRVQLGGALLASGDQHGALRELTALEDEASEWLLDLNTGYGWTAAIRAKLAAGELEEGERCVARAEGRAGRVGLPQRAAAVGCAHSALLLERGDARSAAEAASDATEIASRTGNPLLTARAQT